MGFLFHLDSSPHIHKLLDVVVGKTFTTVTVNYTKNGLVGRVAEPPWCRLTRSSVILGAETGATGPPLVDAQVASSRGIRSLALNSSTMKFHMAHLFFPLATELAFLKPTTTMRIIPPRLRLTSPASLLLTPLNTVAILPIHRHYNPNHVLPSELIHFRPRRHPQHSRVNDRTASGMAPQARWEGLDLLKVWRKVLIRRVLGFESEVSWMRQSVGVCAPFMSKLSSCAYNAFIATNICVETAPDFPEDSSTKDKAFGRKAFFVNISFGLSKF